jgi:hypothetical protein
VKGLWEVKYTCQKGLKYVLGNGRKIKLWHEVWLGECPLKIMFSRLFNICKHKNWEVARVLQGDDIHLTFRRSFDIEEIT